MSLEKIGLMQSDGADNDGGDGNREGGKANTRMELKLMAGSIGGVGMEGMRTCAGDYREGGLGKR